MEDFAIKNGHDPHSKSFWYTQQYSKITAEKGAPRVLSYHGNSLPRALAELFPEIKFDRLRFPSHHNLWSDPANRRKFFENYAKDNRFDPLQAEKWYLQSIFRIMAFKGVRGVLAHHNNDLSQALSDLFPNIGFDTSQFNQSYLDQVENRRKIFLNYAKENGFDALYPENWYKQAKNKILAAKGAYRAISYHQNSVPIALMDLFPDIGLDAKKFRSYEDRWKRVKNRRKFFETYAQEHGFSPLCPEDWHSHSFSDFLDKQGVLRLLSYHKYKISTALLDLFPNIGLSASKFTAKICSKRVT
eukprot:Phypoly_transcript_03000.p1 GENE.Phypoly_transcript_03000~~Phypoly_transcript_03000.p1  ORF type:complete len:301 (-),score=32.11 Phypoly_transcript_03000:189-1091(-)